MERPVVMVTGSNRNTGLGIIKVFAAAGYDVIAACRSEENARQTELALREQFPESRVLGVAFNQRYPEQITAGFAKVRQHFSRLDALVCNATKISTRDSFMELTPESLNEMLLTNVSGYAFTAQEAAKMMIPQHKGSIVMISSVQSHGAVPRMMAYAASKAAINSVSRGIALELARDGIRCNTLIAGAIRVDRLETLSPDELAAKRKNWPTGREATPEEIGNACLFLCSDQAASITGSELNVDSGVEICLLPYNKDWK